ncbi:MAG TPA: heavy metal-associated domain-containing protein [Longimicrobiaceae bacterium]|nr:heavy metal-associated domain-containing protein [Longimicrobiaceae bacterium]
MMSRSRWLLALTIGAVGLAGCEGMDTLAPSGEAGAANEALSALLSSAAQEGPAAGTEGTATDTRSRAGERDDQGGRGGKSVFDQLAEQIPAFGGLYRVRQCGVALVLTDLSGAERAIPTVKRVIEPLVTAGCPNGIRVEPVEGTYTYLELVRVRRAIRPLGEIPGVVGARIDFKQNKVIVVVSSRDVVPHVREAIARLGVPRDAIGIEVRQTRRGG